MAGGGDVKIAAVTASVFAADRERILATGVDEVVHKPFRPQEIFDCMTRLLGARFVHADRATAGDAGSALSPAALASLPDALRAELEQALLSLDPSRVAEAVRKAAEVDRDLGERLGSLADSLEFTVILRALRSPEKAKGAR
jgi:CheY-like chemotaxis protein